MKFGLIGGTGTTDLGEGAQILVDTPYGQVEVEQCTMGEISVYAVRRHGRNHHLPPHQINYRGNIWALRHLDVSVVMATAAVGSLKLDIPPGTFVVCDQFLDFTKARPLTFFESSDSVVHTDMAEPYCPEVRDGLIRSAQQVAVSIRSVGCYVCTEGPRYETAAETRMYSLLGGDVVGMTGVPEVILAREFGLCYGTIAVATNYAPGLTSDRVVHGDVEQRMAKASQQLASLIPAAMRLISKDRKCSCATAV